MSKAKAAQAKLRLSPELLIKIHDLMVRARTLEERLIKMYKQNDGFFWIGGPGEEAFNVPLGLLIKKGQGPKYDYFQGHYRSAAVLLAMGVEPIDFVRQMKNTATDPFSGGRNFINHASVRRWNIAPISSPIEVQFSVAPGMAMANQRESKDALTVVVGGDAGTAEADFATCLVWSTRPSKEVPILMIVTNNKWGISTEAQSQHGESSIADRGKAFGMRTAVVNGLDVEESYVAIKESMEYIRSTRKPVLMEAHVTRLYGHSSASGANLVSIEQDPLALFEKKLAAHGVLSPDEAKKVWVQYQEKMLSLAMQVRDEPQPSADSIWDYVFADEKGDPLAGRFGRSG